MSAAEDLLLSVQWEGEPPLLPMTFAEFEADNVDGMDARELSDIRDALELGLPYFGGGGASPLWSLWPVGAPRRPGPIHEARR